MGNKLTNIPSYDSLDKLSNNLDITINLEKLNKYKTISFIDDFIFVNSLNDQLLGQIKIYKNPRNKLILCKQKSYNNEKDFKDAWYYFMDRINNKSKGAIKVIDIKFDKINSSNKQLIIDVFLEYLGKDLDNEIQLRKLTAAYFSDNQILDLIKNVIDFFEYIRTNNFDRFLILNKYNILFNKGYNFKVNDLNINGDFSVINVYRPPDIEMKVIFDIINKNKIINTDILEKLNVFVLGVIALEMGTLESITNTVYKNFRFNKDIFLDIKERFLEKYKNNNLLCDLINKLLIIDTKIRPSFYDLKQFFYNIKRKKYDLIKSDLISISKKNSKKEIFFSKLINFN